MVQASGEPDRHPNIIARSVQKAAAVENSSLIMGLGSHRPRRTEPCTGEEEAAAAAKGLHFVRFCPWASVGLGRTDGKGPPKRGEGREREQNYQRRTKTSRGKRGDWRRIQILLLCRKEAWKKEGEGETDRRADDATRAAQNSDGHGQVCRKGTSTSLRTYREMAW